jgi:cytochrome c biogenesis protein CcmG/thiol:disulfide interchange protein DsbE
MSVATETRPGRRRLLVLLPLAVFLALAALFLFRLGSGDPSRIPSALIGRPAPTPILPP